MDGSKIEALNPKPETLNPKPYTQKASKSENLPVDEIKPWNIEDLVEEGRGEVPDRWPRKE